MVDGECPLSRSIHPATIQAAIELDHERKIESKLYYGQHTVEWNGEIHLIRNKLILNKIKNDREKTQH